MYIFVLVLITFFFELFIMGLRTFMNEWILFKNEIFLNGGGVLPLFGTFPN